MSRPISPLIAALALLMVGCRWGSGKDATLRPAGTNDGGPSFRLQLMCKWGTEYSIDTMVMQRSALQGTVLVKGLLQSLQATAPTLVSPVGTAPLVYRLNDGSKLELDEPLSVALAGSGILFVTQEALKDFPGPGAIFPASRQTPGATDGSR